MWWPGSLTCSRVAHSRGGLEGVWRSHVLAERAHGIYSCGHRWIVCSLDARSLSPPDHLKLKRIEKRGVLAGRAQSEATWPPARQITPSIRGNILLKCPSPLGERDAMKGQHLGGRLMCSLENPQPPFPNCLTSGTGLSTMPCCVPVAVRPAFLSLGVSWLRHGRTYRNQRVRADRAQCVAGVVGRSRAEFSRDQ